MMMIHKQDSGGFQNHLIFLKYKLTQLFVKHNFNEELLADSSYLTLNYMIRSSCSQLIASVIVRIARMSFNPMKYDFVNGIQF